MKPVAVNPIPSDTTALFLESAASILGFLLLICLL